MKRYYSHYSFIYPDIYLKNSVVEIDQDNCIVSCFPYEKEIERTSFYSGLLLYIPVGISVDKSYIRQIKDKIGDKNINWNTSTNIIFPDRPFFIYSEEGILL